MKQYKIRVPLYLEQKSNFNKHDFSSSEDVEFDYINKEFSIIGDKGTYNIEINEIFANNRDECSKIAEELLVKIIKLSSLIIQSQFPNQHYTHLKLNYNITQISFLEENERETCILTNNDAIHIKDKIEIHDTLTMHATYKIDFTLYDTLEKYFADKEFKFVLDAYYRSLSATDGVTKYFNAFSAIEFIEVSFFKKISINKLIPENIINKMIKSIENEIETDVFNRIKERIKNCLLNSTKETRAEKLCAILNEVFEIYEIKSGVVNNNIDISFIKKIIDLRNSLFHGKKIDENLQDEIKCKSLELILLLQNILINWKT
ncbi:hypothetical protein KP612_06855 [Treponema denticola]|uniref:Apea-like HEPN domain-containing protein n=1 Tax=Treponema denticola H-22 TaxID=999432 RepID=A0A0E2E6R7_TREDN|nr:hypothetical protein [Treponema denticola]EMB35294.1 hypothetical protein HMPREF9726_00569 [Treponema denticola H-22]